MVISSRSRCTPGLKLQWQSLISFKDKDKYNLFNVRNTEWLPNLPSQGLMIQVFDRKKKKTYEKYYLKNQEQSKNKIKNKSTSL